MKRLLPLVLSVLLLAGCTAAPPAQEGLAIVATTYPVFMLTRELVKDTPHTVKLLVQEDISCLHDYTLTTTDMKALETADVVVVNGAGLETFLQDLLDGGSFAVINASAKGFELLEWGGHVHTHDGEHADIAGGDHHDHAQELDPHVWMSLRNYSWMQKNICDALAALDSERSETYAANSAELWDTIMNQEQEMQALCAQKGFRREIITFHDGFAYFAAAYDLHILKSIEEEPGSEASAKEVEEIIQSVRAHDLKYLYTETLGATATADAIARETGARVRTLDLCMSGDVNAPFADYIDRFYQNLSTLLEDTYE